VAQMRPIDKLFGILDTISSSQRDQIGLLDDFMSFSSTTGMEDTCAMLVQILADSKANF